MARPRPRVALPGERHTREGDWLPPTHSARLLTTDSLCGVPAQAAREGARLKSFLCAAHYLLLGSAAYSVAGTDKEGFDEWKAEVEAHWAKKWDGWNDPGKEVFEPLGLLEVTAYPGLLLCFHGRWGMNAECKRRCKGAGFCKDARMRSTGWCSHGCSLSNCVLVP